MRKKIVAANWKMNKTWPEAQAFAAELTAFSAEIKPETEVFLAPPALYLQALKGILPANVSLFAQNMSEHNEGAYTGEISADMLNSIQADGVILGHSERRAYYGETDSHLAVKVKLALAKGLKPIYCNGESLAQRQAGQHLQVVKDQTETALFGLSAAEIQQVVIAYEPVWAIGTGETASPEQAQEIHAHIRQVVAQKYGTEVANSISILYGGSVKPGNAQEIFGMPDVDGGLIGGAALQMQDFSQLIKAL
jgi:triosephosphate isomerase (TIM)